MSVLCATTPTIRPDRYESFLETQRKSKAVLERCGAENVRLIGTIVAGEASGTLAMTWEAADNASWVAVLDGFLGDPDGMALMMESGSESGPVAAYQSSVWGDVEI